MVRHQCANDAVMLKCVCVCVVAGNLALRGKHHVDLDSAVNVQVGPIYKYELRKFQVMYNTEIEQPTTVLWWGICRPSNELSPQLTYCAPSTTGQEFDAEPSLITAQHYT